MRSSREKRPVTISKSTSNNCAPGVDRESSSISPDSESIKRYYELWWENPKDIRGLVFERLNELVRERIRDRRPALALDLGSGKGHVLSMLVSNGSTVTAVEFNSNFVTQLRARFPGVSVVCADVRDWQPDRGYDFVTCIELAQVLTQNQLAQLLERLRPYARRILINVSNRRSLHGLWVRIRGFQAPFIVTYTAEELLDILRRVGYHVTYCAGAGFVTPLSLLRDFGAPIVSKRLASRLEKLDKSFPRLCHLFLVEADSEASAVG